jgi:hypothetical protein
MLRAMGALAHERGSARLQWVALDWNKKAMEFYKSPLVRLGQEGRVGGMVRVRSGVVGFSPPVRAAARSAMAFRCASAAARGAMAFQCASFPLVFDRAPLSHIGWLACGRSDLLRLPNLSPSDIDSCGPRSHCFQVGARERVEEDGTKWVNFIMTKPEIAKLAAAC